MSLSLRPYAFLTAKTMDFLTYDYIPFTVFVKLFLLRGNFG